MAADEDDTPEQAQIKTRMRNAFVVKQVGPEIEKLEAHRIWNLIDYVQSLPYQPGGELGADAEYSQAEPTGTLNGP